ncbi:MAG: hypothetical protein ACR2LJ_01225 [Acidimicrobiales bacterium]
MNRVRISTTVNGERLDRCRRLAGDSDSRMLDQALEALIDRIEARREVEALEKSPYADDPNLAWTAPEGPDLPYDGDVPPDVRKLAAQRRSAV